MRLKKILVFIWNQLIDLKISLTNNVLISIDQLINQFYAAPKVESIEETIKKIISNKASVARYGDGEFKLMNNRNITFQQANALLSQRLKEILLNEENNFLVCLPDVFDNLSKYTEEPRSYWTLHISKYRLKWYKSLRPKKVYYNSFISRCYYAYKDKSKCKEWFDSLKLIWKDKDVLLIEGRKSRLGIGNDLFDNANSIERILVPEENAFQQYDKILEEAQRNHKSKLILLAVGPTATVLAYDLYKAGYQALDLGHIDIEYEWFLRQAQTKISIDNKYVCEAGSGEGIGEILDEKYSSQIKSIVI